MRVVIIARKPLSEGNVALNVLRWGSGALNIDRSRIATETRPARQIDPKPEANGSVYAGRQVAGTGFDGGSRAVGETSLGRWPANLILSHLPGCECVGTVKAPATSSHGERTITRRSGVHAEAGGHQRIGRVQPFRGYADEDGTETIPDWRCREGCPVAALDEWGVRQGCHPAGSFTFGDLGRPLKQKPLVYGEGWNLGRSGRVGDKGGVSRFFKQVKP